MTRLELIVMLAKYLGCFGLFIWGYIEGRKEKQTKEQEERIQ